MSKIHLLVRIVIDFQQLQGSLKVVTCNKINDLERLNLNMILNKNHREDIVILVMEIVPKVQIMIMRPHLIIIILLNKNPNI